MTGTTAQAVIDRIRGVVDEDVHLPEPADRRIENLLGEPGLGDVPGDAGDLRVAREKVRWRQVGDHHLPALVGEARGDGAADAVGAAADDGHLAGETALSQCCLLGMTAGRGAAADAVAQSVNTRSIRCIVDCRPS